MADGLNGIIKDLERRKTAIDKALAALREVGGGVQASEMPASAVPDQSAPAKRKGGMTPAGKKRLVAALKRRWAAKKAAADTPVESAPVTVAATPAARKTNFTPEGRKRLAEAMKKRWAVKRAAAKKAASKTAT